MIIKLKDTINIRLPKESHYAEIRDYGKFVFLNDAEYVKGYSSKYERDRAAEYRCSAQSETD